MSSIGAGDGSLKGLVKRSAELATRPGRRDFPARGGIEAGLIGEVVGLEHRHDQQVGVEEPAA